MPIDLRERISSLTPSQIETLMLAAQHLGSKEIGARLQRSPKTIDNRIAAAMQRLGVNDRDSAIRLVIEAAQTPWGKSLGLLPPLPDVTSHRSTRWLSRLPWPWPTEWRPDNDLSFPWKLLLIVMIACGMMVAVAAYILAVLLINQAF